MIRSRGECPCVQIKYQIFVCSVTIHQGTSTSKPSASRTKKGGFKLLGFQSKVMGSSGILIIPSRSS